MSDHFILPCIMGPTGAGKTAAALALAARYPVSVINADSRQVYRDFPILTAQPSADEKAICPHLFYGVLESHEKLGAGEFARHAETLIGAERNQGRLPVLVGGTGLYFKTLLHGIAPIPEIPTDIAEKWRERCAVEGSRRLHEELNNVDPEYARRIHPNDKQRICRALEVLECTGKTFSWWHAQPLRQKPYTPCKIGIALTLQELEPLLEKRIEIMLHEGALAEARQARAHNDDPQAPGWSGIGCAEVYLYLTGRISLDECRSLWLKNTRAYAKRQLTWFRRDEAIRWFAPHETAAIAGFVEACMHRDCGA